jgi:hypothetical protein
MADHHELEPLRLRDFTTEQFELSIGILAVGGEGELMGITSALRRLRLRWLWRNAPVCHCANPAVAPWLHEEGCAVLARHRKDFP